MIWMGEDILTPTLSTQAELVHYLKTAFQTELQGKRVQEQWEVLVPTTLQVLQQKENWMLLENTSN